MSGSATRTSSRSVPEGSGSASVDAELMVVRCRPGGLFCGMSWIGSTAIACRAEIAMEPGATGGSIAGSGNLSQSNQAERAGANRLLNFDAGAVPDCATGDRGEAAENKGLKRGRRSYPVKGTPTSTYRLRTCVSGVAEYELQAAYYLEGPLAATFGGNSRQRCRKQRGISFPCMWCTGEVLFQFQQLSQSACCRTAQRNFDAAAAQCQHTPSGARVDLHNPVNVDQKGTIDGLKHRGRKRLHPIPQLTSDNAHSAGIERDARMMILGLNHQNIPDLSEEPGISERNQGQIVLLQLRGGPEGP